MSTFEFLSASPVEFYLGTYTEGQSERGIYRGSLSPESGELGPMQLVAETDNPSYLCLSPDRHFLYTVVESQDAEVKAFRRNSDGSLVVLNQQPSEGKGSCHISTDPEGRVLFVANYSTGNIASYPILPDGSIGERASLIQFIGEGPNEKRQKSPHAHSVVPSPEGQFLYACDLGSDKIWIFQIDPTTGELAAAKAPFALVPPGSGPRHIVLSADGQYAYVNNEMGLSTSVFSRDPSNGSLELLETVPTRMNPSASANGLSSAAILLHPNGQWLYVTSRGNDTVSHYSINPQDGTLTLVEEVPAGVEIPRGAAIDPSGQWLLVAGQKDHRIVSLSIHPETGVLASPKFESRAPKPVCISF